MGRLPSQHEPPRFLAGLSLFMVQHIRDDAFEIFLRVRRGKSYRFGEQGARVDIQPASCVEQIGEVERQIARIGELSQACDGEPSPSNQLRRVPFHSEAWRVVNKVLQHARGYPCEGM